MSEEPQEWSEADLASLSEKLAGLSLTNGERAAFAALLENDVAGFDMFSFGLRKQPNGLRAGPGDTGGLGLRANKASQTNSGKPRKL